MTAALIAFNTVEKIAGAWLVAMLLFTAAWAIFRAPMREWENQQLHDGASMREERAERYANVREIDARPDAEVIPLRGEPDTEHGGVA